jgi:hypothetical protein
MYVTVLLVMYCWVQWVEDEVFYWTKESCDSMITGFKASAGPLKSLFDKGLGS